VRPGAGWQSANYVVALAGQLATVALLTSWVAARLPAHVAVRVFAAVVLPLTLLVAQPVLPPEPMARDPWLIGFFPPNQLHNPTTLLSKPIALALFGFGVAAAFGGGVPAGGLAACVVLVFASGLVKPSFLMAFLPAVGLWALASWRRARWTLLVAGLAVPTVLLLSWQFYLRYLLQANDGVNIAWAPLLVIGLYVPTDAVSLATRLLASILFPLSVTLCFARQSWRDRAMVLAWTTLAIGIAWGYLFAEMGGKTSAGDFLWSGQLAVFLLFAVAAAFLVRQLTDAGGARVGTWARGAVCFAILGWHVRSGLQHLQSSWYA